VIGWDLADRDAPFTDGTDEPPVGGAPTDPDFRHLLRQLEASTGGRPLELAVPAVEDLLAEELALLDQGAEDWAAVGVVGQASPPANDPEADALLARWPRW
jgi:hypothetical protein